MKFKRLTRALCIGALAVAVGGVAAMSGCTMESDHPRATISIEFNGTTYDIEYTLYRNMYPVTVRHFIELADNGFYDNTIIHNYTSSDWYGGGYAYNVMTEDSGTYTAAYSDDSISEYLNDNYLEDTNFKGARDNYYDLFYTKKALTASVYTPDAEYDYENNQMDIDDAYAYYTVYGEFSNNGHTIENGALSASFGTLKMYYTACNIDDDKYDNAETKVYVKTGTGKILSAEYEYNCATSLFAIQVDDSSSLSTSSYATFGELRDDDAEDALNDLLDAIQDYIEDECGNDEDKFTTTTGDGEVTVNNKETIAEPAVSVSYTLTSEPIIIKSVKITKY